MYLVEHAHHLPIWGIAGIIALNFAGYYLFRNVNSQKDIFRIFPEYSFLFLPQLSWQFLQLSHCIRILLHP